MPDDHRRVNPGVLAIDVSGGIRSGRVIEVLARERSRNRVEAKVGIERWRCHYNEVHPHSSPGYLTPMEFKARGGPSCAEGSKEHPTLTGRPTSAVLQ
jgi:Integrase core domain